MTNTPKFAIGEKVMWTRDTIGMDRDMRAGTITDVWFDGWQFRYQIKWVSDMLPRELGERSAWGLVVKFQPTSLPTR